MKRWLLAALIAGTASSQAMAWGLGDIGGQMLRKGAENAVGSAVNGGSKQQTQQQAVQGMTQAAEGQTAPAAETEPATAGGVATGIASDAASQAATNAMAKSGIPGAGVAGNVAGGLVKGLGGMFKKKPQPAAEQAPATPEAAPQP
ncbi:MAG TPA: hypothetical protein VFW42_09235 [Fluviicoccus sp.]|nr:hypothetical protein [Fluviicoccus sp.]